MPEHIDEPPEVADEFRLYWTAYADLQHERPQSLTGGARRIPWSAIAAYARHHDLNVDELKRFIWALDSEFIGEEKPAEVATPEADEDSADG